MKRRSLLAAAAGILLAGCAGLDRAPAPPSGAMQRWSGRLALRVDSDPVQTFAALFELQGSAQAGELTLTTPIGSTLGRLRWAPGEAVLDDGSQVRRYASLDQLVEVVTGAAIPIGALFGWLAGQAEGAPGWRVDLSQVQQGKLQAVREQPQPRADLRVIFEAA